jgi:hypothetical protein
MIESSFRIFSRSAGREYAMTDAIGSAKQNIARTIVALIALTASGLSDLHSIADFSSEADRRS